MDFTGSAALWAEAVSVKSSWRLPEMRRLLAALGDPQDKLKFVHIAGTNGKGSTAAMTAAILTRAGYRTGLYTSPALRCFNERMQVGGELIPDGALTRLAGRVTGVLDPAWGQPSEFALVTAIAFLWFLEQDCDIVVLEVGLGGKYDPTNAIKAPEAAVITPIGLDHVTLLGNTLALIAGEKAGILKPGAPAVLAWQEAESLGVLESACKALGLCYTVARPARRLSQSLAGQRIQWDGQEYALALLGDHQLQNAATALDAVKTLQARGWSVPEEAVRAGLAQVVWPARLQVLRTAPPVLLDGAHNAHGAAALERSLTALFGAEKLTLVAGILADKDYGDMLGLLAPHAKRLFLVPPPSPRALSAAEAQAAARQYFPDALGFDTVRAGLDAAMAAQAEDGAPVVCFGSLYMAGEVLDYFAP